MILMREGEIHIRVIQEVHHMMPAIASDLVLVQEMVTEILDMFMGKEVLGMIKMTREALAGLKW